MSHTGEAGVSPASICKYTVPAGHVPDTVPERLMVSPAAQSTPQLWVIDAAVNWHAGVGVGVLVAVGVGVLVGVAVLVGVGVIVGVAVGVAVGVGVFVGVGVLVGVGLTTLNVGTGDGTYSCFNCGSVQVLVNEANTEQDATDHVPSSSAVVKTVLEYVPTAKFSQLLFGNLLFASTGLAAYWGS